MTAALPTTFEQPTPAQLNVWFEVLHRLAGLTRNDPMEPVFAPLPLRQDIDECVQRSWVRAWAVDGQLDKSKIRLLLTPEGWDVYQLLCEDLARQGRPVTDWTLGSSNADESLAPDRDPKKNADS